MSILYIYMGPYKEHLKCYSLKNKGGNTINTRKRKRGGSNRTRKFKDMNCSPESLNGIRVKNSCFTPEIINRIKKVYNSNNSRNKIKSTSPSEIHKQLKLRISTCDSEDCWLKQLSSDENKYLDDHVFAPDKPESWKTKPNQWLSNFDILDVMSQYERAYKNFKFIGPTPIDFAKKTSGNNGRCVWQDLCDFSVEKNLKSGIDKVGIIFNLDTHDQSGSHWVSMFINLKSGNIFYFDSASNPTPPEINAFVKEIIVMGNALKRKIAFKYTENYPNNHQTGNTECGMYSLFFIVTMLLASNKSINSDTKTYKLFKTGKVSDKRVETLRMSYYNSK